jgi:F0F1-type ATP synthase assembly protein I
MRVITETELRILLTALGIVATILSIVKTTYDIAELRSKKKAQKIAKTRETSEAKIIEPERGKK